MKICDLTIPVETHSSRLPTESRSDETLSDQSKRSKIELAINELNMDIDEIRDLKKAFHLQSGTEDVTDALLGLQKPKVEKSVPKKVEDPSLYRSAYNYSQYPVHSYPYYPLPITPHAIPYQHPGYYAQHIIKTVRENSLIHASLKEMYAIWEILIFAPQFETKSLKILLIDRPVHYYKPYPFPNAVLIKGQRTVLETLPDGSMIRKIYTGQSIVELGNVSPPGAVTMIPLESGQMKIKIAKQ